MAGEANWESFKIKLPGQDFLEPVRNVLETLLVFLEVLKAILETIKIFLIEFPNPIAALVKALIALVETLFESLNRTGIYAWFDVPDPSKDPHFFRNLGGFQAFTERFKGSLIDTHDPNRPQPIAGATQSGFVIMMVDAEGPIELIRLIQILMQFFGQKLRSPVFPAPANVKVLPAGDKRDPILSLTRVFKTDIKGVLLRWTLGGNVTTPDPGFNDLANMVGSEFIPPKWIIERSELPMNVELDAKDINKQDAAGYVVTTIDTDHEIRGAPGKRAKQKIRLRDANGDPVLKFQKVIPVTTGSGVADAIRGELGVMEYFDSDVQVDHVYTYRIRAYTGTLPVQDGVIQYPAIAKDIATQRPYVAAPDGVVFGKPSGIYRIRIPKIPPKFDVLAELKSLFLTAFSMNFHIEVPTGAKFDDQDNPTANASITDIGKGSLTNSAGILAPLLADPVAVAVLGKQTGGNEFKIPIDPVTRTQTQMFWQDKSVQAQSARLAGIVGSAMLENGSGVIEQFQQIMTGSYPRGTPPSTEKLASATNLSQMCHAITFTNADGETDDDTYRTWRAAFTSDICRKNVLFAVRFIKSFTLGGTPPDWIQVSILRDIIPWSGQLLYDILAKIQALLDAFKGIFDEIKNFIDMLERKIDVLERFIEFLLSILDFILSLQVGFYLLSLPKSEGDVYAWMEAIDTAGGTKPSSGPGGYSAGVAFAYIAVDVSAFASAFSLIF